MAFENLTDRLSKSFKNLVGKGKLTESNMRDMLQEVRFALIEADVHPNVVSSFLDNISEKALGQEVMTSLQPSEMVVKIVNEELISLLGETQEELNLTSHPSVVMMVGLQGSGKTTSSAKIAYDLKEKFNKRVLLVGADLQRLAAVDQLRILGQQIEVDVFSLEDSTPVVVAQEALKHAKNEGYDTLIVDTAGRLHIDEVLMDELSQLQSVLNPNEILLSVDAMVGQDIVNVAQRFKEQVNLTGLVVTKYDGDSRGGGILSVRHVTQVPVKYVGTGEKIEDLERFYPDRVASRLLGMGDILTLIEQAQQKMDQEAAERAAQNMLSGQFTMDDLLTSIEQASKMGPLSSIMGMMPGMSNMKKQIDDAQSEADIKRIKAIIQSMTKKERQQPRLIRASQRRRIARGAGVSPTEVNRLLNQYDKMKDQMRILSRFMK
ncbi:MAG TPA: signal recognition particle protein [Erysipelothrix sp.]|nr:signal recognition particle protein [Erysipelothrix sp.]